ncbi:uncharacterized protein V6R79_022068 [Siganus canaliculatus]
MAAQVEVQSGEVGRTVVGPRLHLSPLTDSSNSLMEIPSPMSPTHILAQEPNKPAPVPKPRLTPKPFSAERNTTIKPILAPKPHPRPRPESARLSGYKPEPSSPRLQDSSPVWTPSPLSRGTTSSFKAFNKLASGQTTKPVVHPFKPAPPLDPEDPGIPSPSERLGSGLAYSRSFKKPPSAEWSGPSTKDEKDQVIPGRVGPPITRAKSMGFLGQVGQEDQEKDIAKPEETVPLRSPRESKPRPVSAIYLDSPALNDASFPDPRWSKRRPLSADLTSRFESIGLSLHRRTPKTSTMEPPEPEEGRSTSPSAETSAKPAAPDRTNRGSIKARISLLLDSSSSPGPDPQSPVTPVEAEPPVGVKQLIRQLTEDPTPSHRPALKPRPQPLDLSKRFYPERSPDLGSEATDSHDIISKDPPRRIESSPSFSPSDQRVFVDLKDPQEKKASSDDVQTVRASVFENVVERRSVRMVDDGKPASPKTKTSLRSPSFKRGSGEDEGSVFTATFREPASPSSPLRVLHAFDTVQAVEEARAVSESVQPAQREDKATTLRRPRSERRRTAPAERTLDLAPMAAAEQQQPSSPRYLRVGALQKWTTKGLEQEDERTTEDSANKRPKTTEEQSKPKATYFALTGQMQEPPPSPGKEKDVSAKTSPLKRNPSLDNSSGKSSQDEAEDEAMKKRQQKKLKALEREKLRQMEVERAALSGFQKRKEREEEEQRQQERERRKREEERRQQEEEEERRKRAEERLDRERQLLDIQKEKQRLEELRRSKVQETQQLQELQLQRLKEEKEKEEREQAERMRQLALDQEVIRMRELEKEREQQKKEEMERRRKEEQERMRKEEMERKRKEEQERMRKEEMERRRKEEQERMRKEEMERRRKEEQERVRMEEMERKRKEEQERMRMEEMERRRKEEQERRKKEEQERMRKEAEKMRQAAMEQERKRMEEMERRRQEEQERMRREEMERKMKEEQERVRREEMERKMKEEQERVRKEEREKERQKLREEAERMRQVALEQEMIRMREMEKERERQRQLDLERQELERERKRKEEQERVRREEQERVRKEEQEREEAEKMRKVALEQEALRMRELEKERERQRKEEQERVRREEMERRRQEEQERRRKEEMERRRQEEQERMRREEMERRRREEMERKMKEEQERMRREEMERRRKEEQERRRQEELEQQRQLERIKELEKQRLRQQQELEKEQQRREEQEQQKLREAAEKMRQAALEQEILRMRELEKQRQQQLDQEQQELEKQRQRREEQERRRLREEAEKLRLRRKEEQDVAPLRPRVVDLDSVIRTDPVLKASPQRSDPASRWKEPSPRASVLDLDPLAAPPAPARDLFPASDAAFGAKAPPAGEREINWKVPATGPAWSLSPQDPWELNPTEMSVDAPVPEPRKTSTRPSAEQILLRQEERVLSPQASWSSLLDEPLIPLGPSPVAQTRPGGAAESSSSTAAEPVWLLRDPPETRAEDRSQRRSEGSRELNRIRSRSASRRSVPSSGAIEASLNRMRSRSTHREHERHSVVPQKPSAAGDEEKWKDGVETPGRETDSQYGTWETGLRTDDSLTPVSPSSESNFSPSPRKPSSSSLLDGDAVDSFLSQAPSFPDAPTALLDNSALRSRAQLGKRRAARTRPTRAGRQGAAPVGGASEDWTYRDSTEMKPQTKEEESSDEESPRVDSGSAAAQRVAVFPGIDPSALKAHLKKRSDSDLHHLDSSSPSPVSRPPKSPFLPRAARVLPPAGGRENGEEASPQWLKELKSKKRLSQYDNES